MRSFGNKKFYMRSTHDLWYSTVSTITLNIIEKMAAGVAKLSFCNNAL